MMLWIICAISLIISGCQERPQERHYTEITITAPALDAPTVNSIHPYHWTVPESWKELPGDNLRLATFHLLADEKAMDCSIVSLGGMAGGMEANLSRWLGQLEIAPASNNLPKLMKTVQSFKTVGGLDAQVYDFNVLRNSSDVHAKSMLAAMLLMGNETVFIKMVGSARDLKDNREAFLNLVRSLHGK
jgi:hypothetical protein